MNGADRVCGDSSGRSYGVEAGAHSGLAGLRSTTVVRPGWLAEIVKPLQRSITIGKLVVKVPLLLVRGRRTSVCPSTRVT